jgi:pimeloyl-ACP methyl ester carboxylesterase
VSEERPFVEVQAPSGPTRAVVLVLYGGKDASFEASEPSHWSSRRVNPFVTAIHRQGRDHGIAVWKVRYRYRGWNGAHMSPTHDAQWALDEVRSRHGDVPVVLLGHSMGGRTATHVLGDASVIGMVAFGPWLPDEPIAGAAGKQVFIAHATLDKWTSPLQSLAWAQAARPLAASLTYLHVRKTGHFMLWNAGLWTDLAVGFSLSWLGVEPSVGRRATNVLVKAAAGATELTV